LCFLLPHQRWLSGKSDCRNILHLQQLSGLQNQIPKDFFVSFLLSMMGAALASIRIKQSAFLALWHFNWIVHIRISGRMALAFKQLIYSKETLIKSSFP